ncbi:hypothetical protein MM742_004525 [Salmonella enterica]|nr:hypothetical protein [Salmonella enterica]
MKPQDISDKLNSHERYNKALARKQGKIHFFVLVISVVAYYLIYKVGVASYKNTDVNAWPYVLGGWMIVAAVCYILMNFSGEIFRLPRPAAPPKEIMIWLADCADDEDFRKFYMALLSSSEILEKDKHDKAVEEFFYLRCKEQEKKKKEKLLNDAIYGNPDSEGVRNDE